MWRLMAAFLVLAAPAAAQHRSPAALLEAQKELLPCAIYTSKDGIAICESAQTSFRENYADAMAGRLDSWRNMAYFFAPTEIGATHYGIKVDAETSCMWRYAIVISKSDEIWQTDRARVGFACDQFTGDTLSAIHSRARDLVRRVKVVPETSRKAPWYDPRSDVDPKCLDSTVTPLGSPQLPPFVPPAGCPKRP